MQRTREGQRVNGFANTSRGSAIHCRVVGGVNHVRGVFVFLVNEELLSTLRSGPAYVNHYSVTGVRSNECLAGGLHVCRCEFIVPAHRLQCTEKRSTYFSSGSDAQVFWAVYLYEQMGNTRSKYDRFD